MKNNDDNGLIFAILFIISLIYHTIKGAISLLKKDVDEDEFLG